MKKLSILFLLLSLLLFQSCGSIYVGRTVDMAHPNVCFCSMLPKSCNWEDERFKISVALSSLGGNEYKVEGTADYIGSDSWDRYSQAHFTLLLVKHGRVVDTISIAGGQGDFDKTIKFKREFTTEHDFIAVLITYNMQIRG